MSALNFDSGYGFSISFDTLPQDCFSGNFITEGNELASTPFTGIGIKISDALYSLSFIANWNNETNAPSSYTTFTGELMRTDMGDYQLILHWLMVNDNEKGKPQKSNGKSTLYETLPDFLPQPLVRYPYPTYTEQYLISSTLFVVPSLS